MTALALTALLGFSAVSAGAASGVQTLKLSAEPGKLAFNTTRLHAHPGTIRIVFTNPRNSGIPHAVAVTGHGVHKVGAVIGPGKTSVLTLTLTQKGSYTFYCPVPGHEMAGMKGVLTIS